MISRSRYSKAIATLALLLGLGFSGQATGYETGARPKAFDAQVLQLSQVASYRTPDLELAALDKEDLEREEAGLPFRFAKPDYVTINPQNSGTWETLDGGGRLWRHLISCPEAKSLNLGFSSYFMPAGASLIVYASDGSGPVLSFDERDNKGHSQLWTPIFPTDELVMELFVPENLNDSVDLQLVSIGCGYRDFFGDDPEKSDACEIDVVCPEGDPWRDEIDMVGVYTVQGIWKCSGVLINNTDMDGRPLFLTAHHCDIYADRAASVVVYWNFQSPVCGQQGGGSLDFNQTGSTLLADYAPTDFTLIELDESPDPALGVKFAGWDRSSADFDNAVCIHHPSTDEKSISFENDPTLTTSWSQYSSPGDGTHIMVQDWDLGTTEGGSSGSPLFNQDHLVVGQLHGGYAGCGNDDPDWYGRLSVSWDGGGSAETRLSDHLDPLGSDVMVLPHFGQLTFSSLDDWLPSGPSGGPFEPASGELEISNPSGLDRSMGVSVSEDWVDVSFIGGNEILASETKDVTLTLNEGTLDLLPGNHQVTISFFEIGGEGSYDFELVLRVTGPDHFKILGAEPNPFSSLLEVKFTMDSAAVYRVKFLDLKGQLVTDMGAENGVWGDNNAFWNGSDESGRPVPAGIYFCQIQSGSRTIQTKVMLIR